MCIPDRQINPPEPPPEQKPDIERTLALAVELTTCPDHLVPDLIKEAKEMDRDGLEECFVELVETARHWKGEAGALGKLFEVN